MSRFTLERVPAGLSERDWQLWDGLPDRVVFQTREWISFILATQRAEPVVAAVKDGSETVGYFTGLVSRRFGVPILGSPMRGWSSWYMGFNLFEGVSRRDVIDPLVRFAFDSLGCLHLELRDRYLKPADVEGLDVVHDPSSTCEVNLTRSEDEIWAGMTSSCRRCIRKAEKIGVVVEEASEDGFADEYYEQLKDVFARQSLVPAYGVDRPRELIAALKPTGRLLLLRARDPEGRPVATGIFIAFNGTMYFWGGASWRQHQIVRPNEAIMWYAMRHWKQRGMTVCDLGGGHRRYKDKYGGEWIPHPFIRKSRYRALSTMRDLAKDAYRGQRRLLARLDRLRQPSDTRYARQR